MPKKDSDDYILSEYGNWNVAADYSKLKIMKMLYFADFYEEVATFGSADFYEELNSNIDLSTKRIAGFRRLIKTLLMLINNTLFAVKKTSKEDLEKYKKELERYNKIIPLLFRHKLDQRTGSKKLSIISEKFDPALERVVEIKSLINEPLNKYDLIFTNREEFDPREMKDAIKKAFVEEG